MRVPAAALVMLHSPFSLVRVCIVPAMLISAPAIGRAPSAVRIVPEILAVGNVRTALAPPRYKSRRRKLPSGISTSMRPVLSASRAAEIVTAPLLGTLHNAYHPLAAVLTTIFGTRRFTP